MYPPPPLPRLLVLDIWSLAGGAVWGVCGTLRGEDWLEEVGD